MRTFSAVITDVEN